MTNQRYGALVIGGGAFGTSIASVLAKNFKKVYLKVRSKDVYESLLERENKIYLPGLILSENIFPILDYKDLDHLNERDSGESIDLLVSGLPSSVIEPYFNEHKEYFESYFKRGVPFISLSKGINSESLDLPVDMLFRIFSKYKDQICFFSGPTFAKEIVKEQITLGTLAGKKKTVLEEVISMLETPYFKVLPSYDIKGVLLGGALKNILAIAGGIVEGLGFNHNTRAALITRGILEMRRFGKVFNAREETFYGLSGMGDLILTITGDLSRNKQFGLEIAKGRKPQEIIESQRSVVEGYKTTKAAYLISSEYDIKARIFMAMYQILYNNKCPREMIKEIMSQPVKFES